MQPLITVITVVRNNKVGISRTIESVINQNFNNYEYIIIDGKSTDGTLEIISKYEKYISLLISEKDDGIYDAMNKGIKIAKGKYISFLNSGDWYENKTLSNVSTILINEPEIDILHGLLAYYNASLEKEYILGDLSISIPKRMIQHPTCFVRSKLYKENEYDLKYRSASDYNSFIKFFNLNLNFFFMPLVLANFVNDGMSQNIESRIEEICIKRKYHLISFTKYITTKIFLLIFRYIKIK